MNDGMEGGAEADSGAGGDGDGGLYPVLFVPFLSFPFSLMVCSLFLHLFDLSVFIYISAGMKG